SWTPTTRAFASASPSSPSVARRSCAPHFAWPAWTRSSSPPTMTWSTRSCASRIFASGAASSPRAAACRSPWGKHERGDEGFPPHLPLAGLSPAAGVRAVAGPRLLAALAPEEEGGGALREPRDGARRDG